MSWEKSAAVSVVALASFQLFDSYRDTAPALSDLRHVQPGDVTAKQLLLDADLLVGGLTVFIGGALWWLTSDPVPAVMMLSGFCLMTVWYHQVLSAASVRPMSITPEGE